MDWKGFFVLDLEAVIKSAASTERPGDGSAGGRRPRGAPLGLASLNLVFGEAVLAADLITASKSLHVPTTANPFLDPAV